MSVRVEVRRTATRWSVMEASPAGGWARVASYRWKFQAVLVARFYCRHLADHSPVPVELIIKTSDGRIAEKDTYGYDPESSVG